MLKYRSAGIPSDGCSSFLWWCGARRSAGCDAPAAAAAEILARKPNKSLSLSTSEPKNELRVCLVSFPPAAAGFRLQKVHAAAAASERGSPCSLPGLHRTFENWNSIRSVWTASLVRTFLPAAAQCTPAAAKATGQWPCASSIRSAFGARDTYSHERAQKGHFSPLSAKGDTLLDREECHPLLAVYPNRTLKFQGKRTQNYFNSSSSKNDISQWLLKLWQ